MDKFPYWQKHFSVSVKKLEKRYLNSVSAGFEFD